jgi:epoxyqueuosine reductase
MSEDAGAATAQEHAALAGDIRRWAGELGLQALGFATVDLSPHDTHFRDWLAAGHHGEMDYMARHGEARWRPELLLPGTVSVITTRMDYWPAQAAEANAVLADGERGYVARYALGRDYHKVFRNRLAELAERIRAVRPDAALRPFVDSGPVLERGLAQKAGLGWIGKNTLLINPKAGSWFFLGEIYTTLALAADAPHADRCGSCTRCLAACPTDAFPAPYRLDATRCISYLTIEHDGPIPAALRLYEGAKREVAATKAKAEEKAAKEGAKVAKAATATVNKAQSALEYLSSMGVTLTPDQQAAIAQLKAEAEAKIQ